MIRTSDRKGLACRRCLVFVSAALLIGWWIDRSRLYGEYENRRQAELSRLYRLAYSTQEYAVRAHTRLLLSSEEKTPRGARIRAILPTRRPPDSDAHFFVGLLSHNLIRDELRLTDEQRQRIDDLLSIRRSSLPESSLWNTLTPRQQSRLDQLERQYVESRCPFSLLRLREDMAPALELSPWQLERIRALETAMTSERIEQVAFVRDEWLVEILTTLEMRFTSKQIMVEHTKLLGPEHISKEREQVFGILTATQRERWTSLHGEPFEMTKLNLFDVPLWGTRGWRAGVR